jgi:putative phosphoesterase
MRVILTSDTHAKRYSELPAVFRKAVEGADAVVHAGDYGSAGFFNEFISKCAVFYGVLGNNDKYDLPRELVAVFDGVRVAVTHSDAVSYGDRVGYLLGRFRENSPDVIVYGHTHWALKHSLTHPVIINPGSPTRSRGVSNAYAVLEINGGNFTAEIIEI